MCRLKCITSKPMSPGRAPPDQGVHVRAVAVDQAAAAVNQLADLGDVVFEQAERVRVRQHQPGDVVRQQRLQVRQVRRGRARRT